MLISRCDAHRRYTRGCPECQARAAHYRRVRTAALADGTWERCRATPESRQAAHGHLAALMSVTGVTGRRVAAVAGVNAHAVFRVAAGSSKGVSQVAVDAILGVTAQACLNLIDRPTTPVDAVGALRRLRALAVDGWSSNRIGELVGIDGATVRRHRSGHHAEITVGMLARYRELYDKIQSQADPRGDSRETCKRAEAAGWLGPERWADEDIDDPNALPLPPPPDTDDWAEVSRLIEDALRDPWPGKAADYPRSMQREIARQAHERLGWSYTRIAELLGKNSTTLIDYLLHGRRDRREGRRAKS